MWWWLSSSSSLWGPAPIDWCEENFAVVGRSSPLAVAEFNNSWTNAAYVLAAFSAWRASASAADLLGRNAHAARARLFFCCSILLTGIFSCYFHATLYWLGQKLDEVFETWALIGLLHLAHAKGDGSGARTETALMAAHSAIAAFGIFHFDDAFCELHLAACVFLCLRCSLQRAGNLVPRATARARRAIRSSAALGAIAFAGWTVDRVACAFLSRLPLNPQLHAFVWHPATALALHDMCVALVAIFAGERDRCVSLHARVAGVARWKIEVTSKEL